MRIEFLPPPNRMLLKLFFSLAEVLLPERRRRWLSLVGFSRINPRCPSFSLRRGLKGCLPGFSFQRLPSDLPLHYAAWPLMKSKFLLKRLTTPRIPGSPRL